MKKLTNKVRILEAKATRRLHKKSAADHARQAAKFRMDSLKLGCELAQVGESPYKASHPVYEELILPLLNQAVQIANKYGFNTLYQTQTPVEGMPNYTHMLGAADSSTISETMKAQLDLIHSRPETKIDKHGKPMAVTQETPFANETAIELMAQVLYESWAEERGYVPWVKGGNSTMQDQARSEIRTALKPPMPTPEVSQSTL